MFINAAEPLKREATKLPAPEHVDKIVNTYKNRLKKSVIPQSNHGRSCEKRI
jgi:hypothetical protein